MAFPAKNGRRDAESAIAANLDSELTKEPDKPFRIREREEVPTLFTTRGRATTHTGETTRGERSLLLLRALSHERTGEIVAAATTWLQEHCWLRHAAQRA